MKKEKNVEFKRSQKKDKMGRKKAAKMQKSSTSGKGLSGKDLVWNKKGNENELSAN